jgi:hypothetical protein
MLSTRCASSAPVDVEPLNPGHKVSARAILLSSCPARAVSLKLQRTGPNVLPEESWNSRLWLARSTPRLRRLLKSR